MTKPRFEQKSIRQLRDCLERHVFAIPRLQREFVWNGPKAAALLDSIYRGMPIGALTIWETGRSHSDLLRPSLHILPPFDTSNKQIWYLLDGQQRLSVLHQSFEGQIRANSRHQQVDFSRLTFRVNNGDDDEDAPWFSYRKPIDGEYISVPTLLSRKWVSRLNYLSQRRFDRAAECRERLLAYKVPVIVITSRDLEEVREAFIRINSQGMPIGSADRAFARASRIDLREKANDLRAHLPEGFADLPHETILLGFSFVSSDQEPDVGERAMDAMVRQWERKIDGDDNAMPQFLKCWGRYRAAFTKAIDYLQSHFSVLELRFLPSANMVATLAVYFFVHPGQPSARQRREIRKWFWATAVGERYSGRGYRQNIIGDVSFFERVAKSGSARFVFTNLVDRSDILRTEYTQPSARSRAFACLLARCRPCYLTNGEQVLLAQEAARANRNDRHHIFPRGLLANYGFQHRDYNSICNICFVVAEENQSIGAKSPRTYLNDFRSKQYFARVMRSHLIPHEKDSGLWDRGVPRAYKKFRLSRLAVICKALEHEAGIKLFRRG